MTQLVTPVPVRPSRDTRVDIVRGWLQLTIFASHAAGSWIGAWLIHATGNPLAPAFYRMVSSLVGLVALAWLAESAPVRLSPAVGVAAASA